jgi:hypothetical protein
MDGFKLLLGILAVVVVYLNLKFISLYPRKGKESYFSGDYLEISSMTLSELFLSP